MKETVKGNFHQYQILEKLRSGKFSSTFLAQTDHVPVILKRALQGGKNAMHLEREFSVGIQHPAFAEMVEIFTEGRYRYLSRKYIEGISMNECRLRCEELIPLFVELCEAFDFLHKRDICHLDIKPSNLILSDNKKKIKIIDGGWRKKEIHLMDKVPYALIYSPPEQVLGEKTLIDERSDIYSLGLTLFELICVRPPFYHKNPELLMHLMLSAPIQNDCEMSEKVFDIVGKASAKEPFKKPFRKYSREEILAILRLGKEKRFSTMTDFRNSLLGIKNAELRMQN